jgi:hypothetical protein
LADRASLSLERWETSLGVHIPKEVVQFWNLAAKIKPLEPQKAFEESLGITLVGIFDVLAGKFDHLHNKDLLALHWRYSLDPPEFFTLMAKGNQGWHAGYLLDDCSGKTGCFASSYADEGLSFTVDGKSIFEALQSYLAEEEMNLEDDGFLDADCVLMKVKSKVEKFLATQKIEQMERDQVLPTLDFGGVPKLESVCEPFKELELDSIAEEIWSEKGLEKYSEKARYFLENQQLGAAWKLARDIWQRGDEESLRIAGMVLAEVYAKSARLPFQKILELHLADLNREWLDLTDSV